MQDRARQWRWVWICLVCMSACADGAFHGERALEELVTCSVSRVRYPTTREEFARLYDGRGFYSDGNHLGYDVELSEGTAIHPIACGTVRAYRAASGYGTLAVVIEHRLPRAINVTNGRGERVTITSFLSIYGHLRASRERSGSDTLRLRLGDTVSPDDIIGYVQSDALNGDGAEHLHLGIRLQSAIEAQRTDASWFRGYDGSPSQRRWFADPRDFLDALQRSGVSVRWHPPGTTLARITRPDELWYVGADEALHRVASADAVTDRLLERAIPATDEELGCYFIASPYVVELHGSRLVRFDDASVVYEARSDGTVYAFISYEAFLSWGWRDSDIGIRPSSERATFLSMHRDLGFRRMRDGSVVKARDSSEVSVVSDGRRLPIQDWQTFLALGYRDDRIVELDPTTIEAVAYGRGPTLTGDLAAYCAHPSACLVGACDAGMSGGGTGDPVDAAVGYVDATTPVMLSEAAVSTVDAAVVIPDVVMHGTRYEFRIAPEAGWGASAPYRLRDHWWTPQLCANTGTLDLELQVDGWLRCDLTAPLSPFVGSFFSAAHPEWGDSGQLGTIGNAPLRCTPTNGVSWRITDLGTSRVLYEGPASGLPCASVDTQDRHALP